MNDQSINDYYLLSYVLLILIYIVETFKNTKNILHYFNYIQLKFELKHIENEFQLSIYYSI